MSMKSATVKSLGVLLCAVAVAATAPVSASAAEAEAIPTFTKDIAPIFQARC